MGLSVLRTPNGLLRVLPPLVLVLRGVAYVGTFAFGLDADHIAGLCTAVEVRARIGLALALTGRFRAARDGAVAV